MFDPISLTFLAGGASLAAGLAKAIKTWIVRKASAEAVPIIVKLGDKEIRVTGSLNKEELNAIVESFKTKLEAPPEKNPPEFV